MDSLATTCYKALTRAPIDVVSLENQPQHVLAQLLAQAVADRDAAQAELLSTKTKLDVLEQRDERRYILDVPMWQDRVDQDVVDHTERVIVKWQPWHTANVPFVKDHWGIGSTMELSWHKGNKMWFMAQQREVWQNMEETLSIHRVISSALLLYRLCCLWPVNTEAEGWQGYKSVWTVTLRHKATGMFVQMSEWKGAALVRFSSGAKVPAGGYEADLLELMELLCSDKCPHPYDGTVAGSVA